jgi:hydroxypyruvate reductase
MNPQQLLLDCFHRAVKACRPANIMAPFLPDQPSGRTVVVGAGKAAASMAAAR